MQKEEEKTRRENVNQHYEEQWKNYTEEDVLKRVENLREVLDSIISPLTLKKGLKILDLGSGPGIIPFRIAQIFGEDSGMEVYGIDISQRALQLGNKVIEKMGLSPFIHLVRCNVENLPFQRCRYDAVVSNATINLLPDKEKGFNEMTRVLKDEGEIIIADCVGKEGKRCCGDTDADNELWSACVAGAPTRMEMQQLANRAGLEVLGIKDLTYEVSRLVKNELWDWPEFVEYDLEYYVFRMLKRE